MWGVSLTNLQLLLQSIPDLEGDETEEINEDELLSMFN